MLHTCSSKHRANVYKTNFTPQNCVRLKVLHQFCLTPQICKTKCFTSFVVLHHPIVWNLVWHHLQLYTAKCGITLNSTTQNDIKFEIDLQWSCNGLEMTPQPQASGKFPLGSNSSHINLQKRCSPSKVDVDKKRCTFNHWAAPQLSNKICAMVCALISNFLLRLPKFWLINCCFFLVCAFPPVDQPEFG